MAPAFVSAPGDWFSYGFGSIFVISGGLACLKNSKSNHPTEKGFKPLSGSPNRSCVFPLAVLLVLGGLSAREQSVGMQWDSKSGRWVVSYGQAWSGSASDSGQSAEPTVRTLSFVSSRHLLF